MKNRLKISVVGLLMSLGAPVYAQSDSLGMPGDNLDLNAVLSIFKQSSSIEDFEKRLNSADTKINNLDLNSDNQVDYLRVVDYGKDDFHSIVIQDPVSKSESQDVAVIEVVKKGDNTAHIQIVGDETLYGKNYIIEPENQAPLNTASDNTSSNDDVYASQNSSSAGNTHVMINVWAWPAVGYIYSPGYSYWVSPWYWGYYPGWYSPWRPYGWGYYHRNFIGYNYGFYGYRRYHYAFPQVHNYYYGRRVSSGYVRKTAPNYSRRTSPGYHGANKSGQRTSGATGVRNPGARNTGVRNSTAPRKAGTGRVPTNSQQKKGTVKPPQNTRQNTGHSPARSANPKPAQKSSGSQRINSTPAPRSTNSGVRTGGTKPGGVRTGGGGTKPGGGSPGGGGGGRSGGGGTKPGGGGRK